MRLSILILSLLLPACATAPVGDTSGMRYSKDKFSVDDAAAEAHETLESRVNAAADKIREKRPMDRPVTLLYVENTKNLVDTATSFTRDMGAPEAPTARIAAATLFRGSSLRVIDPTFMSADMMLDCRNASGGAQVFMLRTYVSNLDLGVRRKRKSFAPFGEYDESSIDLSTGNGATTDVFTIESELIDCFGNVLRSLSPTVEVTSINRDNSAFFFSEVLGFYKTDTHYVSNNLNGAKRRAIEMVVADMGLFLAGLPEVEIDDVMGEREFTEAAEQSLRGRIG